MNGLRLHLKLTLLALLPLLVIPLMIRALTDSDRDLRALLLPEGCPAPCFLGIRPGVTRLEQARDILNQQDWITKWTLSAAGTHSGQISWEWNERAPDLFRTPDYPHGSGRLSFSADLITDIGVVVSASPGQLWASWGRPSYFGIVRGTLETNIGFSMIYREQAMWFQAVMHCPYYPRVWDNDDTFIYWSDADRFSAPGKNSLTNGSFTKQIIRLNREDCQ